MKSMLIVAIAFLLSGCAADLERQREEKRQRAEAEEHAICVMEYGFVPGTPPYGDCRLQLRAMREQEEQARRAAILGVWGATGRLNPPPAYQPPPIGLR